VRPVDHTIAHDDLLTERYQACWRCGHRVQWMGIREVGTQAFSGSLCGDCYRAHGWQAVDRVLMQRAQTLQRATKAMKK
jgi:hypothetical protein